VTITNWMAIKNIDKSLIVAGVIPMILGITFMLQGKSVVGPSSSFMYANPSWTVIGSIVIAIGFAVLLSGIILWRISLK